MDPEDGLDDNEPPGGWLDPDDRLWRHPSEVANTPWPSAVTGGTPAAVPALRRDHHEARLWVVALLGGTIGALLATGVFAATGRLSRRSTIVRPFEQLVMPATTIVSASAVPAATDSPAVSVAHRVRPAVVQLQVDGDKGHLTGSGVILRSDGHVLTTNHLVDGASKIQVITADGKTSEGRVVGSDPDTDIAVVRISGTARSPYTVAPLGSTGEIRIGQTVIAIGSPMGVAGGPSVTTGVVSALGREVESRTGPSLLDMIQTDAPITPGASGGPLVDANGSVIGITTDLGQAATEGVGFAVPIDIARDAADQLISTGRVVHVWMGVEGEDVDAATAGHLAIAGGALVRDVRSNSPAESAGLHDGDIITALDGRTVSSLGALIVAMRSHQPGDKVKVSYVRDGEEKTCTVTLTARPKNL